jgi:hypothetical protein
MLGVICGTTSICDVKRDVVFSIYNMFRLTQFFKRSKKCYENILHAHVLHLQTLSTDNSHSREKSEGKREQWNAQARMAR